MGETAEGHLDMEAYVMPNQIIDSSASLQSFRVSKKNFVCTYTYVHICIYTILITAVYILFQVPPETIEKAAGLLFFDNVSRNKIRKINGKNN